MCFLINDVQSLWQLTTVCCLTKDTLSIFQFRLFLQVGVVTLCFNRGTSNLYCNITVGCGKTVVLNNGVFGCGDQDRISAAVSHVSHRSLLKNTKCLLIFSPTDTSGVAQHLRKTYPGSVTLGLGLALPHGRLNRFCIPREVGSLFLVQSVRHILRADWSRSNDSLPPASPLVYFVLNTCCLSACKF